YEIGQQVADDPLVLVVDDFVSVDERQHVLDLASDRMEAAKVSRLGQNATSEKRTGSVGWIKHNETPIIRTIVKRVGDLVGLPVTHAESLQVVHYGPSQQYKSHFDAWDPSTPKGKEKTRRGGNRLVTALIYLNEVEAGGATGFPKLDVEVDAVPGRLCLFHDLVEGTSSRHPNSLHGGLPVEAGEKWACNLWFREHRYQQSAGATSRTGGGRPAPKRKKRR
ncbi:MAG: 2OG-Fe(II) oxygenase, partial [Ilumatobacter sp.]|nr:2OG-Fe(II) oxygenase [Ilumatobacter sp.]